MRVVAYSSNKSDPSSTHSFAPHETNHPVHIRNNKSMGVCVFSILFPENIYWLSDFQSNVRNTVTIYIVDKNIKCDAKIITFYK